MNNVARAVAATAHTLNDESQPDDLIPGEVDIRQPSKEGVEEVS